jgi:hypothetical protein
VNARRAGGRRAADPQHRPAGAFIDDVGFALLFPAPGMALPSLYEAATEQPMPPLEMAWDPDAQQM